MEKIITLQLSMEEKDKEVTKRGDIINEQLATIEDLRQQQKKNDTIEFLNYSSSRKIL